MPVVLTALLAGCGSPVFVPEAGPGAPGFHRVAPPGPPDVTLAKPRAVEPLPASGVLDSVVNTDGVMTIVGWANLAATSPRGVLRVVLPGDASRTARVGEVTAGPRPDVVAATSDSALLWSGFSVTVTGVPASLQTVCVLSRSSRGEFRLGGSDEGLCPP